MALFSSKTLSPTTTFLLLLLILLTTTTTAQTAPGPTPPGPINITAILEKPGQYAKFIQLLNQTQQDTQINNQVNNSHDGMTVFAPTDNAFNNLPSGTLNNLSVQQQVQLVLYHICPKYYSMSDLETVSNPVRTLATGQDGGAFGLYFSGQNNQVNVSTGIVEQPVYNALRASFPLAVYQVDKVLLPKELYDAKSPASSPAVSGGGAAGAGGNAPADAAGGAPNNGASSSMRHHRVGIEMVSGVLLLLTCMGMLS